MKYVVTAWQDLGDAVSVRRDRHVIKTKTLIQAVLEVESLRRDLARFWPTCRIHVQRK